MLQATRRLAWRHLRLGLQPEVLDQRQQLVPGHLHDLFTGPGSGDLPGQIGARDQAATEHDVFHAADLAATTPVFDAPDVAIGEHRHLDHFLHPRNPLPVCRRLVAVDLGPRMHHDMFGTAFGQGRGTHQRAVRAVEAQAHLGGDWNVRGDGTTDVLDDLVEQLGFLEQYRTTTGFVDGLGRTAEVQVDHFGTQLTSQRGIFRQAHRIGTEQLHTQRHTGGRPGTVEQLRAELVEIGRCEQLVVDPNELGHAPVNTTHTGQHIAQDVVDQPLHGRQSNLHEKHTRGKTCGSLLDCAKNLQNITNPPCRSSRSTLDCSRKT
ncbi:hypothetical protein D9M73_153120 [compost metagenome]